MQIFGVSDELTSLEATSLRHALDMVLTVQYRTIKSEARELKLRTIDDLLTSLSFLRRWFDPIASGKRLREEVSRLSSVRLDASIQQEELFLAVGADRWLVTPEGVVVLWLLLQARESPYEPGIVKMPSAEIQMNALATLTSVYKEWNQQRIRSVTGLLQEETATLRPTAAGLLFVLLVNRNTDRSRRLPAPRNQAESDEISRAIAIPTLSFAHALSKQDKATERGLDLYRGWALGEIARRFGQGLHQGDEGIWIDPEWELAARLRLRQALVGREAALVAVDSALTAYQSVRPVLSALGVAFERPSNTLRLRAELLQWTDGERVSEP
ncbi:hypothetical protein [Rathayibacter sp. AY1C9]|uniref:hypothetical protein n=1 Tax=Rathayibacter sp. AY1C9 TaxID=2080541 RepID=UPI0011B039E6|nr:hypothetical protein [Rathayibacter sp. AY1C9]